MTILKLSAALVLAAVAMLVQIAAFSAPAHAAGAEAAKAKKKTVKPAPAPQNCIQAVQAVNAALRARAVPRYRLKTARTAKQRKIWKKKVKQADRRVNAARASLKVQCQGSGTTSALDAQCALSITSLDKLINLEYDRKIKLKKVKGNSKKAKAKRKVLKKRLKHLGEQIKAQTATFAKSCSSTGTGNGGSAGGSGGGSGSGSGGSTGDTGPAGPVADTTAPGAVTITGPSRTNDNTPTFEITAPDGEAGGHIECRIDDGEYVTVTSPWTTPELSDGQHTITCRYVDEAGNAGDPTSVVVNIDTTAPAGGPAIDVPGSGPGGENNGDTPTVIVTPPAGETGGHIECRISGNGYNGEFADFTEVSSPWTLPVLPEGTYTITCHYVDEAGNTGPDTSYTLTIDRTAPGAPGVSGPGNPTSDATPQISVTTSEPGGTVECNVDGGAAQAVSSPFSTGALADGPHVVSCTQTDAAGNTSESGQATVVVDTTAPGSVTISGPSGATSDTTPSFNLSGAAQGDKYECRTDNGAFAQTGAVYTTAALADGAHTVTCHLVDAAGNVGPNSSAGVTIDTKAPGSVTISGPSVTNDTTPTLTITTSESGGHVECRIDSGSFQTVTSPWTLPALSEGQHTVVCHYVSGSGVNGPDSTYTVTIDTTAPSAVTMTGPSGLTNDNTPTYALGGGAGGSFQCKVDGGAYAAAASPFTTAALSEGAHTVTCRAVDAAGNATAEVSKSIAVDTNAPTLTIADGTPRWDGRHDFTFTASETATVQCKVDAGAYATVTSPFTTAVLSNGSHTLTCIGTDAAGNATAPVVKAFGVFKDPVTVSKSGGFQWGLACTGNTTLNSWLGCPDSGLSITIPANPNGLTGNYVVDLSGQIKGLASTIGCGSTYTMNIIVDGSAVASDSATVWFDIFGIFHTDLAASKTNLTLSSSSAHTIQLSLKSSALLSVLPSVSSSSLTASIHH